MNDDERNSRITKMDRNRSFYDTYYQKPSWWFKLRYDTQEKRKTVLHLISKSQKSTKNQRVLEIGFGSGEVLFSFDTNCEIYGVEISNSAISRAQKEASQKGYSNYRFSKSSEGLLDYPDAWFDIVIASHVLEHVEDDHYLVNEIFRVLKPHGIAILLIPINENYDDPNHVRHYTSSGLIFLTQGCGFKSIYHLENELIFHLVEKFYFNEYNKKWKIIGPLISVLFNFPTALLPFGVYEIVDRMFMQLGFKPRQFGCVMEKKP